MSRVDELIAELCPEGVQHLPLGDVATISGGSVQPSAMGLGSVTVFSLPSFDQSRTPEVLEGALVGSAKTKLAGPCVLVGKLNPHIPRVWRLNSVPDQAYCSPEFFPVIPMPEALDLSYLYFFILSKMSWLAGSVTGSTNSHKRLHREDFLELRIPVPPLEVQREIVRILDTFTELGAELEAELEARRRQYEQYRAHILTPGADWRATTLGAVSEVFDGPHATPKKTSSGPWYLSISSLKDGNVDLSASAHLSVDDLPMWTRRVAPQPGDTLFSYETRIGQAAYWGRSDPAALGRRMGILRPRESQVVPKFLTIAYLSPSFQALIESKTVRGSTVDRIPVADLQAWPILIPPIEEQSRIIELLDKFDALVNDLSIGLPAELAARRKQYEYYRDKLLTFRELEA